jgi:hypothetical protein
LKGKFTAILHVTFILPQNFIIKGNFSGSIF